MSSMNVPSLRDRIQDLIERGGDPLRCLLPEPDTMARRASKIRNDLAHEGSTDASDQAVYDATEELLLVLDFHLLGEAGFQAEEIAHRMRQASRNYSGLWMRRQHPATSAAREDDTSGADVHE
jgi:hypothetical protein